MPNETLIPIDGEVTTYLKVEKADGTVRYLKVVGEQTLEISKELYEQENR